MRDDENVATTQPDRQDCRKIPPMPSGHARSLSPAQAARRLLFTPAIAPRRATLEMALRLLNS